MRVSTAASLTDVGNRLSKIYTRTGDDGSTGLGDGSRVQKDSLRVTAYGTVDELNSTIGMVLANEGVNDAIRETLTQVQHELFDLGGELCIPGMAMIDDADVDRLETVLDGFNEPLPVAGDRLVCLRNDRTKGLINGGLWRVEALGGVKKDFVKMTLRSEDEGARAAVKVAVLAAFFEGREGELAFALRRESDEFDYGYALTVHKAQGSQWDNVMLFDESFAFREHRARWLYTGLTRAARRLTVVR